MSKFVSVLVDGDNISGKHAERIRSIATKFGDPSILRAYVDAQQGSEWHSAVGYRVQHAGTGKNAADILLALDAIELALSKGMRCFVIASSDGDFTHIATRLREYGATVVGVGEAKAPQAFRACCSEFFELDSTPTPCSASKASVRVIDVNIRDVIAANSKGGKGIRLADLAPQMHRLHGVRISTYPEKTWRAYLAKRPSLYELDPRGPDAFVRFRPAGFGKASSWLKRISRKQTVV